MREKFYLIDTITALLYDSTTEQLQEILTTARAQKGRDKDGFKIKNNRTTGKGRQ